MTQEPTKDIPASSSDRVIELKLKAVPSDNCQGCLFEPFDCGWLQEKHPCHRYSREEQGIIWISVDWEEYETPKIA